MPTIVVSVAKTSLVGAITTSHLQNRKNRNEGARIILVFPPIYFKGDDFEWQGSEN